MGLLLGLNGLDSVLPGTYSVPLVADTTYTVGIRNVAEEVRSIQITRSPRALGTLDWSIEYDPPAAVVPLPPAALSMLAGLAMPHALGRRRGQRSPATAPGELSSP